jgi:acetoin utilization deacetylase AcuC-like enzyme
MMWHSSGSISFSPWTEPEESWENPATKRRLHNLLQVSGIADHLVRLRARHASKDEITRFHDVDYVERIKAMSDKDGGNGGDVCRFSKGTLLWA